MDEGNVIDTSRKTLEDSQDQAKSKHEERNQAGARHHEEIKRRRGPDATVEVTGRWGQRQVHIVSSRSVTSSDRTRWSNRTLASREDWTRRSSVRSTPERFQSGATPTGRVRRCLTGRWQRQVSWREACARSTVSRSGRGCQCLVRTLAMSGQLATVGISSPTATFSLGLFIPHPTSQMSRGEARKHI